MRPLAESYSEISDWFASPLGRRLLIQERKVISDEMRYLFGYHFMQLSSVKGLDLSGASRINHCFSVAPKSESDQNCGDVQCVANFDELPFEDEMIDVTVLHHVLEFSKNPQQVVKEAARVTIPRGYVIFVVFNPLSIAGLFQPLASLLNFSPISRRRALRAGRMRDWLELLDFSCVATRDVFHSLPINSARFLGSIGYLDKLKFKGKIPGGLSYVLVARKDKVGLTPIKPKWDSSRLLDAMPIPKQAIPGSRRQARVMPRRLPKGRRGLVLPFRHPHSAE